MTQKTLIRMAFLVSIGILLSMNYSNLYGQEAFPPGSKLPSFNLDMSSSADISAYLRVKATKSFPLSQIPAKLMILEFFTAMKSEYFSHF